MHSSINGVAEEPSAMDLDDEQLEFQAIAENKHEDQDEIDPFIKFINYASSIISPQPDDVDEDGEPSSDTEEREREGPGWSWIASRVLKTCISYSSGVTSAILLSELSQVITFFILFLFLFLMLFLSNLRNF